MNNNRVSFLCPVHGLESDPAGRQQDSDRDTPKEKDIEYLVIFFAGKIQRTEPDYSCGQEDQHNKCDTEIV